MTLLELQGYHGTGLTQILEESSAPKGSLYFHFPGGKQELVSEAILVVGKSVKNKLADALNANSDLGSAIKAYMVTIAHELKDSEFRKGCPVATVAMETSATHDKLRVACEAVYESWFLLVKSRLLKAGLHEVSAESWATLIWSAIEGSLLLSRNRRTVEPLNMVASQLEYLLSKPELYK